MNSISKLFITLLILGIMTGACARRRSMDEPCSGTAKYRVTFYNFLSDSGRFRNIVPEGGLAFSPLTGVTHDPRVSLFTIRGFASKGLESICENGNNAVFLEEAKAAKERVTSVVTGEGGIPGGTKGYIEVTATCENWYLTVASMIAPSPDWIVQINNFPLRRYGKFVRKAAGRLIAYDCGTDSGRDFTDPADTSLDIPTNPVDNIVPLEQDETDRFRGRVVGYYKKP